MPAHLGYQFVYRQLVGTLDTDERLDLDVALGLPGAAEARSQHRRELFEAMGVEVR